ncbi:MAG TPA: GTPase HflX [Candidatus Omnitrophica bacterium]|nr:GTPase HflX [Candidatus Omnitrophota bacterium]
MEKAILVTVKLEHDKSTWDVVEREHELKELAKTAGAEIVAEDVSHRDMPTPDLYIGKGKAEELTFQAAIKRAGLVIFNNDLSGTQHRNLEKELNVKVVDRTQLILDIFARHAKTLEGKTQVELAQLEYSLPRLAGRGAELSRLGGGIGTRGPGEQKLEVDRRRIRDRIIRLKQDLKSLEFRRSTTRVKRGEFSLPTVVFVGYTSAGKSTLFNALTGSQQQVSSGLFTTLDPLTRAVFLPNKQKVLLADTVGFISQLPHHLVESFKATLEEVVKADLLVHVLDISSPKAREHFDAVCTVLTDLGAEKKTTVLAFNKIDLLEDEEKLKRLVKDTPDSVAISALKHLNFDAFFQKIEDKLSGYSSEIDLLLPLDKMELVDFIYREGKVKEIDYTNSGVRMKAILPVIAAKKLKEYAVSKK